MRVMCRKKRLAAVLRLEDAKTASLEYSRGECAHGSLVLREQYDLTAAVGQRGDGCSLGRRRRSPRLRQINVKRGFRAPARS